MSLYKTNKLPSGRQKTGLRTQKVSRAASNIRLQDEECLEISALIFDCIACSDLTKCFVFVAEQSELKSTKDYHVTLSSWPNIKFDRDGAINLRIFFLFLAFTHNSLKRNPLNSKKEQRQGCLWMFVSTIRFDIARAETLGC